MAIAHDRADKIMAAAGVPVASHAASGRYALSEVRGGIRFSATHARGFDEFGMDFQGSEGLARAEAMGPLLEMFGFRRRDNRTDLHAYRVLFRADPSGAVDPTAAQAVRVVAEALRDFSSTSR